MTPTPKEALSIAGVRFTHPERVVFPEGGFTKERLARYYEKAAAAMLPHLADRPLTLVRCPEGVAGECFYVKHAGPWAPKALRRITIAEKTKTGEYLTVARPRRPDRPGADGRHRDPHLELAARAPSRSPTAWSSTSIPAPASRGAACRRRLLGSATLLTELGLASCLKTSGGKGLHVVVPLVPRPAGTTCVKDFSQAIGVQHLAQPFRTRFVAKSGAANRSGRIFVDYLRNNHGATTAVAAFRRARGPGCAVSMPVAWSELDSVASGDAFHLEEAEQLLTAARRSDPWPGFGSTRQSMTAARLRAAAALGGGATR